MRAMTPDWKRLAEAIRAGRKAKGPGYRQEDVAREAGVGLATVQRLESGTGYKGMPRTIEQIERALGWAPGSAEGILVGHPAMPEMKFPPEDVKAILAYIKSIQGHEQAGLDGAASARGR